MSGRAEWHTTTSAAADRGTRFHAAIAGYVSDGIIHDGEDDIAALLVHARAYVDDLRREWGPFTRLFAEVSFAWSHTLDEGFRLPLLSNPRDYSQAGAGRFAGTADIVAIECNGTKRAYVADWKTGDGSNAGPQLRALALMVARAHGLDVVTVEALEVSDMGVRPVCREELDAFALDAIAGELGEAIHEINAAEPRPGPHCGELYCPARASCPAGKEAAEQLVPVTSLTYRMSTDVQSGEHAAWMLDRVRLVEAACKQVKDAIKEACPEGGWALDDGSKLSEGSRTVTRFDKGKAVDLCKSLGATDEQLAGLEYIARESSGMRLAQPGKRARR